MAATLALASCAPSVEETAREVEAFGFTDVQVTGWRWYGCGRDDTFSSGFVATNVAGRRVSGVVCSGIAKGATVRLDP